MGGRTVNVSADGTRCMVNKVASHRRPWVFGPLKRELGRRHDQREYAGSQSNLVII